MLKRVVMKTWKPHTLWENLMTKDNLEQCWKGMEQHHLVEGARPNGLWVPRRWKGSGEGTVSV